MASQKMPKLANPTKLKADVAIAHIGTPRRNSTPADMLPMALATTVIDVMRPAAAIDRPMRSTSSVGSSPASAMY